jgi:4-alpha-glucanotransferase
MSLAPPAFASDPTRSLRSSARGGMGEVYRATDTRRMNLPGRSQGNCGWRYEAEELTPALRK